MPEDPNFTAPGRARAYSISPASVFAGNAGLAITTIGAVPTMVMELKSLLMSNGSFP